MGTPVCVRAERQRRWVPVARADLDALRDVKTVLLTTYRRGGTPVATPVSIAFEGQRAFFRTFDRAGKTKRLRRDPRVEPAPSTLRGKPIGPPIQAHAMLLQGDDARLAARALARRHRVLQAVLVPVFHRLGRYSTMHSELCLERS